MNKTKKYLSTEDKFNNLTKKNSVKFNELVSFLKTNNETVENFHSISIENLVIGCKSPYEKYYKVFLDSINASGGNNLTLIGKGCKTFLNLFEKPENDGKLNFNKFCIENNITNDFIEYFNYISSGSIVSFREKKAALFMRDIYYLQKQFLIFEDVKNIESIYRPIPVDVVISEILKTFFKFDDLMTLSQNQRFLLINDWANYHLKNDYYLIESIWFWGYFTTKNISNGREIGFNDDKYISNNWFFPDYTNIEKFNQFVKIISTGV